MNDHMISDYLAICETKARYCRAVDIKDWACFADVLAENVEFDTTKAGEGGCKVYGRDVALDCVRESLGQSTTVHHVHSPEINFLGPDVAEVVWAMQDRVLWDGPRAQSNGGSGITGYGHYHERYVRCSDGRWRIAVLQLCRLHVDVDHARR
jgi:hypothetical protein